MSRLVKAQRSLHRGDYPAAKAALGDPWASQDIRLALVLGRIEGAENGPAATMEVLQEARTRRPNHAPAHLEYAVAAWDAGQFDQTQTALEQVLALQPENDVALSYHALALMQAGEMGAARAILRKHGFSDNRMFRVRLTEWMEQEWLVNGRFFAQRAAPPAPAPRRPSLRRAQRFFYAKQYEKVLSEVEPLYAGKPEDEGLMFASALAAELLHDYERAISHLGTSWTAEEDKWPDALRALRGRCRLRVRDFAGAAADFGKVLILGPEDFGLNYSLGVLCLAHGEQPRARDFFRRTHTDYMVDTLEYQFWQMEQALFREEL